MSVGKKKKKKNETPGTHLSTKVTIALAETVWSNSIGTLESVWTLVASRIKLGWKIQLVLVDFSSHCSNSYPSLIVSPMAGSCFNSNMFLAQFAGVRVGNKDFVLKHQGSVFWLQIAASECRGTGTETGSHCVNLHWFRWLPEDFKEPQLFFGLGAFFFFFFRRSKTTIYLWGNLEFLGQAEGQKTS